MGVPDLLPVEGTVYNWVPSTKTSPYSSLWWMNSYVTRVPETAVGWLVAQGWQVVTTYEEDDVTYYTMARQSMNNWAILQTLLNEYTQAYNEGRSANSLRYANVIELWNSTIAQTREQLDVQGDVSDAHVTIIFNELDTLVSDVEDSADEAETELESIDALVSGAATNYLSKVETLDSDFTTHRTLTRSFLVDLGTTDLARINEHYNNLLARTRQDLVNRGLYSSAVYTQMQVQIERERNEAIAKLNDQLNREKLDNEHKLYSEEMATNGAELDGRARYTAIQLQRGQFLTDTRRQLALMRMQARLQRIQARLDIRDREDKLMAYQLDTRNNLIVGLFGFIERREDAYPSMESITKLVAGLGDAGGGWVTP